MGLLRPPEGGGVVFMGTALRGRHPDDCSGSSAMTRGAPSPAGDTPVAFVRRTRAKLLAALCSQGTGLGGPARGPCPGALLPPRFLCTQPAVRCTSTCVRALIRASDR